MAIKDMWNSTLVYFGVREEEWGDEYYEDGTAAHEDLERGYSERPNVRRLSPRRRGDSEFDEIFSDEPPPPPPPRTSSRPSRSSSSSSSSAPAQNGHREAPQGSLVVPKTFNDAQTVADKLKAEVPVIINLQTADADLTRRLIDFASGLTYALDGSMQRVADRVFLLTPHAVKVSAEDKALLMERGFFNQY
jgi:cell division inhibitor SepF